MLIYPTGLFSGDYISALMGCWSLKFLHTLQPPKMYFKSDVGRRAASCWALPHISRFILFYSFFSQPRDLRAPSADRRETLHSDQYMRPLLTQVQKLGVLP